MIHNVASPVSSDKKGTFLEDQNPAKDYQTVYSKIHVI